MVLELTNALPAKASQFRKGNSVYITSKISNVLSL